MSINHHTPIPATGVKATAASINSPMGELDASITQIMSGVLGLDFLQIDGADSQSIAVGAITPLKSSVIVDTEGAAASDDLDTISGGSDGLLLFVRCANAARVVTLKHGTGNLVNRGGRDIVLSDITTTIVYLYNGTDYLDISSDKVIPLTEGGTGQITAQLGINALTQVAAASTGQVLTKSSGGDAEFETPTLSGAGVLNGTAGENLAVRDFVYLNTSSNTWFKVDTDAVGAIKVGPDRGVVTEATGILSTATGTIQISGEITGFSGLTPGGRLYASTTPGAYTQTRPTLSSGGSQVANIEFGVALSATLISLKRLPIIFLKRDSLANNGTLTIEGYSDVLARKRFADAYLSGTETGATLAEYASSNQDDSVWLRGATGAGATVTPDSVGTSGSLLGDASDTEYRYGQSFIVTAGKLTQLTFSLGAATGSPVGQVTWSIHEDNGGIPGTVLQTGLITPTASSNNTITVDDGIFLAAATTYWFTVELAPQATNVGHNINTNETAGYADGVVKADTNASGAGWLGTWVGGLGGTWDMRCSITTSAETPRDKLAQGFQISSGSDVNKVSLYLRKVGAPTGNLTLRIETDSAGDPSGTPVTNGTSDTVAASTLSTSYGEIEFTFSTPPTLAGSTQYHLVLETADSASDTNYVAWGADLSAPSYADGVLQSEISSSWGAESADAIFTVSQSDTILEGPVSIRRWDGGTGDVAIRFDSGSSGLEADTKTTFKNTSGVTLDLTCRIHQE